MTKIGILVVTYNAASTLAQTLDRIPAEFRSEIHEVLVGDDYSQDSTHLVALGYQQISPDLPLKIVRHPKNLGYGGNQKWGYQYAIEHGWDVVVLLHGDGQYAPELLPSMIEPIVEGRAKAVFGSRIMNQGEARRGGMPAYKFVGNRILTTFQNAVVGTELTEWHSGYRAYDVKALVEAPARRELRRLQLRHRDHHPAPRGGVPDPRDPDPHLLRRRDLLRRRHGVRQGRHQGRAPLPGAQAGLRHGRDGLRRPAPTTSRRGPTRPTVASCGWMSMLPPSRILDLGCSDGELGARLMEMGHEVVGVDFEEHKGVREKLTDFFQADLEDGIPEGVGGDYDVVLCADVLEHVRAPEKVLDGARAVLRPGGSVITSIPNFGHWYPRARVAIGRFDYDARGILDRGHLRFFTKRSFAHLVASAGWEIRRQESIGLPLRGRRPRRLVHRRRAASAPRVRRADRALVGLRPQLFAYQFIYELAPAT